MLDILWTNIYIHSYVCQSRAQSDLKQTFKVWTQLLKLAN